MKGIEKKELETKRAKLVEDIADLEIIEKENSKKIHIAIAEKSKLKIEIVTAKNKLVQLDALIAECKELKAAHIKV